MCSFISCFNREALLVDEMDDKILLAAFYNGVNSDLVIISCTIRSYRLWLS